MDAEGPLGRVVLTVLGLASIGGAFVLAGGTSLGESASTADISNVANIVATAAVVDPPPVTTTTVAPVVVTTTTVAPVETAPIRTDLPILRATTSAETADDDECMVKASATSCAQ